MSKEYPCIYHDNGLCKKFSKPGVKSYCALGPCEHETPSNADRINAMSIEEKAAFLTDQTEYHEAAFSKATWADPYGNSYRTKQDAIDKWIEWLQQPCGGADHA